MKIFTDKTFKVDYRNNSVIYFIDESKDEIETLFNASKIYPYYRLNHKYHYASYDIYWNKTWNGKNYRCSGIIDDNNLIMVWRHHKKGYKTNHQEMEDEILTYLKTNIYNE